LIVISDQDNVLTVMVVHILVLLLPKGIVILDLMNVK